MDSTEDSMRGSTPPPRCLSCSASADLRYGYCFDCATNAEAIASHRSVASHLFCGFRSLFRGYDIESRIYFRWAWERLTSTGDYAPGGEFEQYKDKR
jgi:hypothetical protein